MDTIEELKSTLIKKNWLLMEEYEKDGMWKIHMCKDKKHIHIFFDYTQ